MRWSYRSETSAVRVKTITARSVTTGGGKRRPRLLQTRPNSAHCLLSCVSVSAANLAPPNWRWNRHSYRVQQLFIRSIRSYKNTHRHTKTQAWTQNTPGCSKQNTSRCCWSRTQSNETQEVYKLVTKGQHIW